MITDTENKIDDILDGLDKSCIVTLTDRHGVITYANDSFCEISKYSREELIGSTHKLVNSGFHTELFWKKLWNTISSGHIWRGEIKNITKDGGFYWAYATILPQRDEKGDIVKYMAIRSEITEKKQLEETQNQFKEVVLHSRELEIIHLKNKLSTQKSFPEFIGRHPKIIELLTTIKKIAKTNYSVLIEGESGTGKELVARMIHDKSERSENIFLPIDTGAIPDALFESEFFGHKKGAFTDASQDKLGYFETCKHGSLFLDEIANLPLFSQTKLLRVLQEKKVKPVGSNKEIKLDVRMIFATNANLEVKSSQGSFRGDLYHRIAECIIKIPPLRERESDIILLAKLCLENASDYLLKDLVFHPNVEDALLKYNWPGNVRELQNRIRQASLITDKEILPQHLFPEKPQQLKNRVRKEFSDKLLNQTYDEQLFNFEKNLFETILNANNGNKLKAATKLGMYYATFCRKLKKYGLQ